MAIVARELTMNKGAKVVIQAKLRKPVNIKGTLFPMSLLCFFCHHERANINPTKRMELTMKIKFTIWLSIRVST